MFFRRFLLFTLLICTFLCLTACEYDYSFTNSTIMCTIEKSNWGEVASHEDYWSSTSWVIYYDGTIEYYENYNLQGKINYDRWDLKKKELEEIQEILMSNINNPSDMSSCDGEGWNIKYYGANESLIGEYSGYIYGHQSFERLVNIIQPQ